MALMNKRTLDAVAATLFGREETNVFAVLDGAAVPGLLASLDERQPEHVCLYRGELEPDLAETAPYLIKLERHAAFSNWLLEQGWGRHWGIFALSREGLQAMRHHFRKLLVVYDANNRPLYFRYYDPRVLRLFLPTCQREELTTIFGPVASYVLEAEDPQRALRFRTEDGALFREEAALTEKISIGSERC